MGWLNSASDGVVGDAGQAVAQCLVYLWCSLSSFNSISSCPTMQLDAGAWCMPCAAQASAAFCSGKEFVPHNRAQLAVVQKCRLYRHQQQENARDKFLLVEKTWLKRQWWAGCWAAVPCKSLKSSAASFLHAHILGKASRMWMESCHPNHIHIPPALHTDARRAGPSKGMGRNKMMSFLWQSKAWHCYLSLFQLPFGCFFPVLISHAPSPLLLLFHWCSLLPDLWKFALQELFVSMCLPVQHHVEVILSTLLYDCAMLK